MFEIQLIQRLINNLFKHPQRVSGLLGFLLRFTLWETQNKMGRWPSKTRTVSTSGAELSSMNLIFVWGPVAVDVFWSNKKKSALKLFWLNCIIGRLLNKPPLWKLSWTGLLMFDPSSGRPYSSNLWLNICTTSDYIACPPLLKEGELWNTKPTRSLYSHRKLPVSRGSCRIPSLSLIIQGPLLALKYSCRIPSTLRETSTGVTGTWTCSKRLEMDQK